MEFTSTTTPAPFCHTPTPEIRENPCVWRVLITQCPWSRAKGQAGSEELDLGSSPGSVPLPVTRCNGTLVATRCFPAPTASAGIGGLEFDPAAAKIDFQPDLLVAALPKAVFPPCVTPVPLGTHLGLSPRACGWHRRCWKSLFLLLNDPAMRHRLPWIRDLESIGVQQ